MKFISSLELIESPVEKLALKGLPNEISALRSNLRTSVISGNKKMMNDIQDGQGEVQFNGQIKHSSEISNQVKNVRTLNSCDFTVKKVIIPVEWEKKLAESSIDSNGLSESSRMAPGFTTDKVNEVHLESEENNRVPKEGSSMETETVLAVKASVPEQSMAEASNGQHDDVTNGRDEWSNEASKLAGEESLSNNHLPHAVATNVANDCLVKMPLQTESCSPKNVEYDVEMDESSAYLGIQVKGIEKCVNQENGLSDEAENTENLNSSFEKDQLDTTFGDQINSIKHSNDQGSEMDIAESYQENMVANKSTVTTDTSENLAVESKEQSRNAPKSDYAFNFYDRVTANNTEQVHSVNDFSSISSDDGNSRLDDIVDDLENMGSLNASNAELDNNTCDAVDQSDNLDELNSEFNIEEPDDEEDDDMSVTNDFMEASTENYSEIDIQDNVEDLENIAEGSDDIDTPMDVDQEIENGDVQLEIDKTDEHDSDKTDELVDTESAGETDKFMDAERVVNEITEHPDSEEELGKTDEFEEPDRGVDKGCEYLNESTLGETGESAGAEETLGEIGNREESEKLTHKTCELKDEVPPYTSSDSANVEVSSEIGKLEESEKVISETLELSNEAPLRMTPEECETTVAETNLHLHVASVGKTDELSKAEEPLDKDTELLQEVGLIKGDEAALNKDDGIVDEVTLDKTNEPGEAEVISDRTSELPDKITKISALSDKTDEPVSDKETLNKTSEVVDESMLGNTDELDNKEARLDKSDQSICEVASDKMDKPDEAEATLGKPDESMSEVVSDKTIEPDDAEEISDKLDESMGELASSETNEPDDSQAIFDKSDEYVGEVASSETNEPDAAEALLDKHSECMDEVASSETNEPDDSQAILYKCDESVGEVASDETNEPDDAKAILDKPSESMDEAASNKTNEPDDAETILAKPDEPASNKTDKPRDAEAILDKSDEHVDETALGKTDESMDTDETSDESHKLADVEGGVKETTAGARKEEDKSELRVAETPKENEESLGVESKDEAVSEESVDTKGKVLETASSDVSTKVLSETTAPEKCLESKPENGADVTVDKLGVKRLASEDEVTTEVKRTKIDKEEATLVTEGSETEAKEVNGEVFRTAGKRLSEPVEGSEAKKPRLELDSEISDGGATQLLSDVDTVHNSDHSSKPEDKNKVEPQSESKEQVSDSDKVTDSTKEEEASSLADPKPSSEAAALAEKDASESKAKPESAKPEEVASSKKDEPQKSIPPKPPMSNLDLAIEAVVAASAAAADAKAAAEAAKAAAIDVEDDDDEVVETVPSKPSEPKKLYSLPFVDKLHSNIIKKMGRNELEEFVMQKVCEVLTERCQLGRLRQQVQALEEQNESWRKKTQMLQKQLKDLELVTKRFSNDARMKRDRPQPVKVTRSVGLQVHMPNNGPPQPGKQRLTGENNTRNQPPHRRRNRTTQNTPQSTQSAQQSQPATTTVAVSSSSTTSTSNTTVQQPQPQPQQTPASTGQQQQQPALAQIVTTAPTQPVKTVQQNARTPVSSTVTVQKVVAPNLAKMGTTATLVNPRTSTSNLINTTVKLPTTKPVPIRPAIAPVSTQNTITTVNSVAGSPTTGLRVASASQLNSRTIRPGVTATLCPVSKASTDSKVIDLTDEDDKSKLNIVRLTTSSAASSLSSSVVTTATTTTTVHPGAIRVVHPHQLTGNATATILTAGNQQPQSRFAYLMPSSASPGQQRQVLIATSAAQVRPGMVTMSSRPTMSPTTFLLKNGSMLPIQQPGQAQTVTNAAAILRPATSIQQPATLQTVRAGQPVRVSPSLVGRLPTTNVPTLAPALKQHPAPLPAPPLLQPSNPLWKCAPPKPELKTSRVNNNKQQGIVLSWNMQLTSEYEEIASYQLFAYQEGPAPPNTSLWKKVGDVKALPLPMACTLTQFMEGHKYHFAVRAVDVHSRVGPFSAPRNIVLTRK